MSATIVDRAAVERVLVTVLADELTATHEHWGEQADETDGMDSEWSRAVWATVETISVRLGFNIADLNYRAIREYQARCRVASDGDGGRP